MTSDQQNQFEAEWPPLARRLQAMLRRKGLSDWLVEDVVQETGCRLIRMWNQVDRAKPLWPLVTTIALNHLRDETRKGSWKELIGVVPDSPSGENVESRGIARLELRELGGAMSRLNDSQRSVLIAEVTDAPSSGADPSAIRMLRMRARKRLHQLMDQASVLGVTAGMQLRRVMRETEVFISKALPLEADRVSAAALSVVAALSFGLAGVPDADRQAALEHESRSEIASAGSSLSDVAADVDTFDHGRVGSRSTTEVGAARREAGRGPGRRSDERRSDVSDEDDGFSNRTGYTIPIANGTYVSGSTEVELEGFDEEGRDGDGPAGTGSVSCSTSPSGGAEASCTHGGDGWSERRARVKQQNEVWVNGERVI